jgi:hypothetical protein
MPAALAFDIAKDTAFEPHLSKVAEEAFRLVRGVVVDDRVQILLLRRNVIDRAQELEPLPRPVPVITPAGHVAEGISEAIVGLSPNPASLQRPTAQVRTVPSTAPETPSRLPSEPLAALCA